MICNQGGLDAIPDDLPATTKYLSLGENGIREVAIDAFQGLRHLKSVRLDNNSITAVARFAFRGLNDVDEISLQKNPLDHLGSYSFAELRHVARLYLGYNRIATIDANAFYDSNNIRELSLVGNPLTVIRSNAFANLVGVQFFYFPTGIRRIESNAFKGLKDVGMLRLERMDMTEMESRTFFGLSGVAGLEIRGSQIGVIAGGAFEGLSGVDYLNVEANTVGEIRKNAFKGIRQVGVLTMLKNAIETVDDGALQGLAEAAKGNRINFTDNHVSCDCRLRGLARELAKMAPDFADNNYCQFPEDLAGERASVVDIDELSDCPTASPLNDDVFLQEKTLDLDIVSEAAKEEVPNNGGHVHRPSVLIAATIVFKSISWYN